MICWCAGSVTEKIRTIRYAAFASLVIHVAFGWWILRGGSSGKDGVIQQAAAPQRLLVKLIAPMPDSTTEVGVLSELVLPPSVNGGAARRTTSASKLAINPRLQPEEQQPAGAAQSFSEAQVKTPASLSQTPKVLNLDLSPTVKSTDLQRRKAGLSAAVDAMQSENSQTTETRAFSRLAPAASSIVSETIMADGSRMIKFSAGVCMHVVNPSSRSPDDMRKPVIKNC